VRGQKEPLWLGFWHTCLLFIVVACTNAFGFSEIQHQLARIFVGRSFTIRDFYQGDKLSYDSTGTLVGRAKSGYWSRDGMVLISSVYVDSDSELVIRGERQCIEFDPTIGEFSNVRTGDNLEISIHLQPTQLTLESAIAILQRVFITSHEKLIDIAPPYWRDCLTYKVFRPAKNALWECEPEDKTKVPEFAGKDVEWDIPPRDTSLRNGTQTYVLRHRVAYIRESGLFLPRLQIAPDPFLRWEQRRTHLRRPLTCVLSILVGEDGRPSEISVVTPVGMGLDDDAIAAVQEWHFSPAKRDGKPIAVHARVMFLISGL
jgi:TonB family protein